MITKIVLPGGAVAVEWKGSPPLPGEPIEVWTQTPYANGDPFQHVTRGVAGRRRWVTGAPSDPRTVCLVDLVDILEST